MAPVTLINHFRNYCYFLGLATMAFGMPLSKALLSFSLVLITLSWFIAPDFKKRVNKLTSRKSIWVFILGYLVVAAGLLYSNNIGRNISLLFEIKIALLLLPVVVGTFDPLSKKQLIGLLKVFTLANIIATAVSASIMFHLVDYKFSDVRETSIFISSVRFALLVTTNILLLGYVFFKTAPGRQRLLILAIMLWFVVFLGMFQSLTGIMVLMGTALILALVRFKNIARVWRLAGLVIVVVMLVFSVVLIKNVANNFYAVHKTDVSKLNSLTVNGNKYLHNLNDTTRINGHLVWINVCESELRTEWAKRSSWPFDSLDLRKWIPVKKTLIYYLSSMGLTKDSVGVAQLTERDIRNIEYGHSNKALAGIGLRVRVYDVLREFDSWQRTGKPAGSITIRINSLSNGFKVFVRQPWFGTGYGDINDAIQAQFETDNLVRGHDMRQNPHNQFLTVLIGAGLVGFIVFVVSLFLPGIIEKRFSSALFIIAFCIVFMSFLTDDTLERMVGSIITAYFFSLFLFGVEGEK